MKRKLRSLKAVRKTVMKRFHVLIPVVMSMLLFAPPAVAAAEDKALLSLLPAGGFAEGWVMDEKPALFTQDTLFDHINGEAELYIPYGFDALATARYMKKDAAGQEIAVDVYRMGSLLDAFGIWSNYRKADTPGCALGADCVLSSSQMMFYQDRYFVRLQATGTPAPAQDVFLACGRALSQKLPQGKGRPGELELLRVRGVVPKTERYLPQSVLGYPFFRRGMTAEANLNGERAQVFVVFDNAVRERGSDIAGGNRPALRKGDRRAVGPLSHRCDPSERRSGGKTCHRGAEKQDPAQALTDHLGCSKMPRCKAPEVARSEAYFGRTLSDEGRGQRRRWVFWAPASAERGAPARIEPDMVANSPQPPCSGS